MISDSAAPASPDAATRPPVTPPPRATARGILFGLLFLAIPFALVVLFAMTSADPTGGCGGG